MNNLIKPFRNHFAILIIALFSYLIYSSFINYDISKGFLHYGFSKHILSLEEEIVSFQKGSTKALSSEIIELKYKNDSLIFWSYNQFPKNVIHLISDSNLSLIYDTTGVFLSKLVEEDFYKTVYLTKLVNRYPFENEFLKRSFTWKPDLMKGCKITQVKSNYPLRNSQKGIIGYLHFGENYYSNFQFSILYLLYIFLFISILVVLLRVIKWRYFMRNQRLFLLVFLSLLYLFFNSNFSFTSLKPHQVFQPSSFVLTALFPSVNSFLTFLLSLLTFVLYEVGLTKENRSKLTAGLQSVFFAFVPLGLFMIIPELVLNSASFIQWNDFSTINIASILMYSMISLLVIMVVILANHFVKNNNLNSYYYAVSAIIFLIVYIIFYQKSLLTIGLMIALYLIIYAYVKSFLFNTISFSITAILLFSLAINSSINVNLVEKELDKRKIFIQTLALNQDPEVEYLFSVIEEKIYKDTAFVQLLDTNWYNNQSVQDYLNAAYFSRSSHWKRYDFQFTTCNEITNLILKPQNDEINCYKFFYNNLISKGTLTSSKNLYRMEYGSGQINYLGIFRFALQPDNDSISDIVTVYTEINSKIKRKGFTKLLSPSGMDPFERIRDYSLARYKDGSLIENYGDFTYPAAIEDTMKTGSMINLNFKDYNHLLYRPTKSSVYVLSRQNITKLQSFSGFASIFIFIFIIFVFLYFFYRNLLVKNHLPQTFSFRLQTNIILILSTSLLLIAAISTFYIRELSVEKDKKSHTKTAYSLRTEFEQKLRKSSVSKEEFKDYLFELSLKFSGVFGTDINLYDLNGKLIVTTRPELFSNQLLSDYMNPVALKEIRDEKQTYISVNEKIGKLKFLSAYMPFHDSNGEIAAYLHLPYIAQQDQLTKEIGGFVMTVVNIYMLIIVLSTLLILLFSNYIIRPLRLISDKMNLISFGGKNEKIEWNRKDEFGDLVAEYNRMVDQIGQSSSFTGHVPNGKVLGSKWHVKSTHEIKNPLTPMKLSSSVFAESIGG